MTGIKLCVIGTAIAGAVALTAAQLPPPFAQTQPGQWEIEGAPGAKAPVKQCVADVASLARFEHRGKSCGAKVISSTTSSVLVDYSCGSAGFGRSQVDVITPRSLRIATQGISDQLPFNYVLQARRVGDCPEQSAALRH